MNKLIKKYENHLNQIDKWLKIYTSNNMVHFLKGQKYILNKIISDLKK